MEKIEVYTDGAYIIPKNVGSFSFVVVKDDAIVYQIFSKPQKNSTSNRMEMQAVISALNYIDDQTDTRTNSYKIYSDSQYVVKGINEWIHNWRKNNFKGKKNVDLWKEMDMLHRSINASIDIEWIRGHNGNKYNELADELCTEALGENPEDYYFKKQKTVCPHCGK